jgi:septum formation protein
MYKRCCANYTIRATIWQTLSIVVKTKNWPLPPLILASASPRRQELVQRLDIEFRVVTSGMDELHDEQFTARELAQINAYRKARAVAKIFPDSLVLGADTLVYLGTKLFGKPADAEEAFRMLRELSGRTHQVVTGICLMHLRNHRQRTFSEVTDVRFRPLRPGDIRAYLDIVNPLDKAGAYAIQEHGELIVEEISGSFSNVIGLPMEKLEAELTAWVSEKTK